MTQPQLQSEPNAEKYMVDAIRLAMRNVRERRTWPFGAVLGLTGLVVTKLDGTAKGGVLCAIARERPIPVYFIGVGEKLEDLETFNAREFAQALLG